MINVKNATLGAVAVAGSGFAAQMGVALDAIKFTSAVIGLVVLLYNVINKIIRKAIREEMSGLACVKSKGLICDANGVVED